MQSAVKRWKLLVYTRLVETFLPPGGKIKNQHLKSFDWFLQRVLFSLTLDLPGSEDFPNPDEK